MSAPSPLWGGEFTLRQHGILQNIECACSSVSEYVYEREGWWERLILTSTNISNFNREIGTRITELKNVRKKNKKTFNKSFLSKRGTSSNQE